MKFFVAIMKNTYIFKVTVKNYILTFSKVKVITFKARIWMTQKIKTESGSNLQNCNTVWMFRAIFQNNYIENNLFILTIDG